jgi:hypothetical protein
MDNDGVLLVCDSRADKIYQFGTRKREVIRSWPARGGRRWRHGARSRPPPSVRRHADAAGDDRLRQPIG